MKLMKQLFKCVDKPNLPTGEVSLVAISCEAKKAIRTLHNLNIETLLIPKNEYLPEPVNSHADLQMLHLKENRILLPNKHLFTGESKQIFNVTVSRSMLGDIYPSDVPLNCKIIGNIIICNTRTIATEVLDFAESEQMTVIDVKQGYSGCSICVLDENTIITDDIGIFTAVQNFLNDTLLIEKDSIRLKGYNYGFIGGCCGKIGKNKLAVNGRIESHTNYKDIIDLCSQKHIDIIELSDDVLTDVGGILPLCQKAP